MPGFVGWGIWEVPVQWVQCFSLVESYRDNGGDGYTILIIHFKSTDGKGEKQFCPVSFDLHTCTMATHISCTHTKIYYFYNYLLYDNGGAFYVVHSNTE